MSLMIEKLKKELTTRKAKNPHYSLRAFANQLNISPSQLSQLVSGKRPLTSKMVLHLAERLKMAPQEKTKMLTDAALSKLDFEEAESETQRRRIREDEFALIGDWIHLAILAFSEIKKSKRDSFWLAKRLKAPLSQVSVALHRLTRMGLIDERARHIQQVGALFEANSEIPSSAIRKYHSDILHLAGVKIDEVENEKRDYSSVIFAGSPEKVNEAKKRIAKFQDELAEFMKGDEPEEVFVLGCQLFPVSFTEGGK